jgi:predicted RND superfamily exporter protein
MLMIEQWLYAVVLVCVLLLYLLLSIFLQKITTKRMLKKSPLVEQPILQSYTFSEENFTVTNLKSAVVSYDDVTKFKKAKDFYLIQTVNRKTFLVLFDGFDNENERDEFNNFMIDRLGLKKH